MANGGFLIVPRVRVLWGDINLTSYNGPSKGAPAVFSTSSEMGGPLVYNVSANLVSENEAPTASFSWDPSAKANDVYEWLLDNEQYRQARIRIDFFYAGGKQISLYFRWAGQSANFGNDMSVKVKLQSEFAGVTNAALRSTVQAYERKEGIGAIEAFTRMTSQYGLSSGILSFNPIASEQLEKVFLKTIYSVNTTFGTTVTNLAKQTGHTIQPSNIFDSKLVLFAPYSFLQKGISDEKVLNGKTDIAEGKGPIAEQRYGYLMGPSMFDSITRDYLWRPPQQETSNSPSSQDKTELPRDDKGRFLSYAEAASRSKNGPAKATSAPLGPSQGSPNPGVTMRDNPYGPSRQIALTKEKTATLAFETLMTPAITGIKPNDIVFIPRLDGKNIEDWIVTSVIYTQTNGGVNVSVSATRDFATKSAMNTKVADSFLKYARSINLIGPSSTLEAWDNYAWG